MSTHYDAVVVGGGHNGLTCAAYLAKAGRKVLVLERRHVVGGAAVTEEIHPGFQYTVCSYVVSLLRPEVIRDLKLADFGLSVLPLECAFTPFPDGRSLCRWPDAAKTREEIAQFSSRDADMYPEFGMAMGKLARFAKANRRQPGARSLSDESGRPDAIVGSGKAPQGAWQRYGGASVQADHDERLRFF